MTILSRSRRLMLALTATGCLAGFQPCLAQFVPTAQPGSITASFALVPGAQRTPDSIPLLLRLRNNTGKPLRVFKDFFTPDLFTAAVYFELQGPALGLQDQGLFGMEKVSFPTSWHYKFIKIKPGRTEDIRFDLAKMTSDKQRIPPGTYTLGGFFGINQGYPPKVGGLDGIYAGRTTIPPMTLVIINPRPGQALLLNRALPAGRRTPPAARQAKEVH